jgi:RNA polymerase sigma-70 factor (ECF subfamily)
MTGESSETTRLLWRAAQGDQQAWGTLLVRSRDRLRRMVALRLDRRLQGRVDPSDIIQEACIDASARLAEYARQPDMPFFLWLRFLTGQRLLRVHRQHLGAEMGVRQSSEQKVGLSHTRRFLAACLLRIVQRSQLASGDGLRQRE